MKLSFFVPGTPIAKARHHTVALKRCCGRTTTRNECPRCGNTQMEFVTNVGLADKKTENYEAFVALCGRQAGAVADSAGPVSVRAEFRFPVPESRRRKLTEGQPHTQRPDLDNLVKAIKDGLNQVAWRDDCCVVRLSATKSWTHGEPGVEVIVESVQTDRTGNEPKAQAQPPDGNGVVVPPLKASVAHPSSHSDSHGAGNGGGETVTAAASPFSAKRELGWKASDFQFGKGHL